MSVRQAIESTLYSALVSGGSALWSENVYAQQRDEKHPSAGGTILPYVVFDHLSGGDANLIPSRIIDTTYQVVFWTLDSRQAVQGGDLIETILRDSPLSFAGYQTIRVNQLDLVIEIVNDSGHRWFGNGADYRIRLSQI